MAMTVAVRNGADAAECDVTRSTRRAERPSGHFGSVAASSCCSNQTLQIVRGFPARSTRKLKPLLFSNGSTFASTSSTG